MLELGNGSVRIIRQRVNDKRDTMGAISFIALVFNDFSFDFAGTFLYCSVDIVFWNIGRLGLVDSQTKGKVEGWIAAVSRGNGNSARQLRECFGAFRVFDSFLMFDGMPFGMTGHRIDVSDITDF